MNKKSEDKSSDLKPVTPEDIKSYLDKEDDFPFELRTLSVIRKAEIKAEHSETYEDMLTGKPREFDIRIKHESDGRLLCLAIECKNVSKGSPLCVCAVPRREHESNLWIIEKNDYGIKTIKSESQQQYLCGLPVGKSLNQIRWDKEKDQLKSSDKDLYSKWSQAVSSLSSMIQDGIEVLRSSGKSRKGAFLPFVIVPDSTLFVAEYDADGNLARAPYNVEHCQYLLNQRVSVRDEYVRNEYFKEFIITHLEFFTLSAFSSWIAKLGQHDQSVLNSIFGS